MKNLNSNLATLYHSFNKEMLLPLDLKNKISLDKENLKEFTLPESIKGGFRNYNVLFHLSNVNSESKDLLVNEFKKVIEGLEKNKIYSLLATIINKDYRQTSSIFPKAIFIHSRSSNIELANLVLDRLFMYEGRSR